MCRTGGLTPGTKAICRNPGVKLVVLRTNALAGSLWHRTGGKTRTDYAVPRDLLSLSVSIGTTSKRSPTIP